MVGLESMVLRARRDLKQVLGRDPALAEIAALLKVPPLAVHRAWKLLTLPPAAFQRHLQAGRAALSEQEYLVLSLRSDPERGGVHSAEQVSRATGLTEEQVLRLEDSGLAKLRAVRSPDLP